MELERQVEYYKDKLRRTCAKLTEVLAIYQQVCIELLLLFIINIILLDNYSPVT